MDRLQNSGVGQVYQQPAILEGLLDQDQQGVILRIDQTPFRQSGRIVVELAADDR